MASLATKFLIFVFLCGAIPVGNLAQELENDQECELFCEGNLDAPAARSCSRGCRFFVISKFLKPTGDLRAFCKGSCEEAYGINDTDFFSCDTGCGKQLSLAEGKASNPEVVAPDSALLLPQGGAEEEGGLQLHLARPIMQVRRVVARVMCNFRILKKSVLTYFMRDDNTILAVESNPEVIVEVSPSDGSEDECGEEQLPALQPEEESANSDFPPSWSLENMNPFSSRVYDDSLSPPSREETVTRVSLHSSSSYTYLLHLLLLLAAVSLSLLALSYCFAVARHQRQRAAKAANLAIAVQSEPLKLVRPEELTKLSLLEDDQAGPLPNKHDLALTHASV